MGGVGVGVEETDRHRLHRFPLQLVDHPFQFVLVQREERCTIGSHTLGELQA